MYRESFRHLKYLQEASCWLERHPSKLSLMRKAIYKNTEYLFFSVWLSVSLFLCMSACMYVCLSVSLSMSLSVLDISPPIFLLLYLFNKTFLVNCINWEILRVSVFYCLSIHLSNHVCLLILPQNWHCMWAHLNKTEGLKFHLHLHSHQDLHAMAKSMTKCVNLRKGKYWRGKYFLKKWSIHQFINHDQFG